MSNDDLRRALEEAGSRPVPPPDPTFANALEQHLRGVATTDTKSARAVRTPRWMPRLVLAAAAILVVVAGALVAADSRDEVEVGGLQLTAAVDATVVLPDGTTLAGRAGMRLVEGAVVRTGAQGRVTAGASTLGAGSTALVADGRLQLLPPPTSAPTTSPPAPPPTRSSRSAPATTVPLIGGVLAPTSTRPPSPTSTTAPPSDSTVPTRSSPTPVMLRLAARYNPDGSVGLMWSQYVGGRFFAYLVLRAQTGHEPVYPPDSATAVAGGTRMTDHTRFLDRPPSPRVVYRVVAVDDEGRELARSPVVFPTFGERG